MSLRAILRILSVCAALAAFAGSPAARTGEVLRYVPQSPESTNHYLFYLHGGYVERNGSDERYRYREIVEALAGRGFTVIADIRSGGDTDWYARMLAAQVRHLLDAGVPSWHVGLAGHGKGGYIALAVAALLGRHDLRFGILAACGREGTMFRRAYRSFMEHHAAGVRGRFLVMWDRSDEVAADCDEGLDISRTPRTNLVLETGRGHELFFRPHESWLDPLVAFLRQE